MQLKKIIIWLLMIYSFSAFADGPIAGYVEEDDHKPDIRSNPYPNGLNNSPCPPTIPRYDLREGTHPPHQINKWN